MWYVLDKMTRDHQQLSFTLLLILKLNGNKIQVLIPGKHDLKH